MSETAHPASQKLTSTSRNPCLMSHSDDSWEFFLDSSRNGTLDDLGDLLCRHSFNLGRFLAIFGSLDVG